MGRNLISNVDLLDMLLGVKTTYLNDATEIHYRYEKVILLMFSK